MTQHEQNALDYFGARYLNPMLGMWISVDPPSQNVPARGTTHGCQGILDESSSSDELKPKGNLPELLKNADEEMVPLIVEEF